MPPSDGSPVTAEDVKFSIERVMDESVAATFGSDFRSVVDRVNAPDEKTVEIVLKQPCAVPGIPLPAGGGRSVQGFL